MNIIEYELIKSNIFELTSITTNFFLNPDTGESTGSAYTYEDTIDTSGKITKTAISLKGNTCISVYLYNYFMILLPDDLIFKKNCSKEMIKIHKKYNSSVIASMKVEKKNVSRWGIFKLTKFNRDNFYINDVVEKPMINNAPSNYAVIGRYILSKKIFKILKKIKPKKNNELHITDAIRKLILNKDKFIGHVFSGKYLDCGTMKGYINSSIEISKL